MVIYVGAETAYSGWVATYTNSVLSNKGAQVTMAFWFGLLLARASAPFVLRAVEPRKLFFAAISAATVFALALLFATTLPTLAIVAFLLGAGIGTLYPLQVSFVAAYAARRGRDVPGWFFALGNLGGALLPAVVGQVGVATGSVRTAMTVPLLALLIVIALQGYAQARLRQA
jgi:fucose permease